MAKNEFQEQYEILTERINRLRKRHAYENDESTRFKLEQEIGQLVKEREELEKGLQQDGDKKEKGISKLKRRKILGIEWWKIIIPAIVALIGVFTPIICNYLKEPPKFEIATPYLNPDSTIVIIAQNKPANREKRLNIRIDEYAFINSGIPIAQLPLFSNNSVISQGLTSLGTTQLISTFGYARVLVTGKLV
jgi:hypothetical protein